MLLPTAAHPEDVALSSSGLDAVDAGLQALIDKGELAGAVTLVARHGLVARVSVLGRDNLEHGTALRRDTIFRIYSMTKPVTAVAMMILHDAGLWRATDPIAKFLPEFDGVTVFDGVDASGAPKLVWPQHAPTMGELMTHTAGFTYGNGESAHDALFKAANPWSTDSLGGFVERLARVPLAYQPGTKWIYGVSMDVQGAIIERLSGMSLAEFYRTRLFEPLGMVDTGFFVPPGEQHRLATLYRSSKTKGLIALERPPMLGDNLSAPRIASGGGGLVSTLDDYARFAQMLVNKGTLDGVRILSEAAVAEMSANHLSEALLRGGFGIGAQQIRPGMGHGYNCAVYYAPVAAGLPVGKGSFQWDGAAGTWFWVDPQNDLIFVGMIQRFSLEPDLVNAQHLTQRLLAGAIQ